MCLLKYLPKGQQPLNSQVHMGTYTVKDIVGGAVVTIPMVNEVTDQGVITALDLESVVWFGMTYGAWFKIGMGVALALLIVERSVSIRNKLRRTRNTDG